MSLSVGDSLPGHDIDIYLICLCQIFSCGAAGKSGRNAGPRQPSICWTEWTVFIVVLINLLASATTKTQAFLCSWNYFGKTMARKIVSSLWQPLYKRRVATFSKRSRIFPRPRRSEIESKSGCDLVQHVRRNSSTHKNFLLNAKRKGKIDFASTSK